MHAWKVYFVVLLMSRTPSAPPGQSSAQYSRYTISSLLASVRASTQSIAERPVEPEVTADDVDEVEDVREVVTKSLVAEPEVTTDDVDEVVDLRELVTESLAVEAKLLKGFY